MNFSSSGIAEVEAEVAAWYDATTLDDEKTIVRRLNKAALDHVVPYRRALFGIEVPETLLATAGEVIQ